MARASATLHYLLACSFALLACWLVATSAHARALPQRLQDTGFPMPGQPDKPQLIAYSPQYPLWTDGADKRRWFALPAGTHIDARQLDAWVFPKGTRLWKEFAFEGRPVETRYMELGQDGRWRFGAYVWSADGQHAELAPAAGQRVAVASLPGGQYRVPSRADCMVCHGSAAVPVLGLSAVQLAGAPRLQPGAHDLADLERAGWIRRLSALALTTPPVAGRNLQETAALGYLHGNCAHCHNTSSNRAPVSLTLAQRAADPVAARREVLAATVGRASRFGQSDAVAGAAIIVPGQPEQSLLLARMRSRHAATQMPPLGTQVPDSAAIALITRWIAALNLD